MSRQTLSGQRRRGKREEGEEPVSKHQPIRFSLGVEISGLTRDWTAEPVSRDHISSANGYIHTTTTVVPLKESRNPVVFLLVNRGYRVPVLVPQVGDH